MSQDSRSQRRLRTKNKIADRRDHRTAYHHGHIASLGLAGRNATHLAHCLQHQFEAMHVALGQITAAGVEW